MLAMDFNPLPCDPHNDFLEVTAQSGNETFTFEDDQDVPTIPFKECLEYALCAYHKALQDYDIHVNSLQPGQPSKTKRPSYREFADMYNVNHTTLFKRFKGIFCPSVVLIMDDINKK